MVELYSFEDILPEVGCNPLITMCIVKSEMLLSVLAFNKWVLIYLKRAWLLTVNPKNKFLLNYTITSSDISKGYLAKGIAD